MKSGARSTVLHYTFKWAQSIWQWCHCQWLRLVDTSPWVTVSLSHHHSALCKINPENGLVPTDVGETATSAQWWVIVWNVGSTQHWENTGLNPSSTTRNHFQVLCKYYTLKSTYCWARVALYFKCTLNLHELNLSFKFEIYSSKKATSSVIVML